MNWYLRALKKYAVFRGRARRKEYWMFVLFNLLLTGATIALDNVFKITIPRLYYGPIYLTYWLVMLLPSLAVIVRRMHDIGKSGKWFFIILIPVAGPIWMLVLLCTPGTVGANYYGEDPKPYIS